MNRPNAMASIAVRAVDRRARSNSRPIQTFALVVFAFLLAGLPARAGADPAASVEGLVFEVYHDVDAIWAGAFDRMGMDYRSPDVVIFAGGVDSACGYIDGATTAATCDADETIYLNERKLTQIADEWGEFAVALVVADAWGFHVLDLLGVESAGFDRESQASCLAGVWAWFAEDAGSISPSAVTAGADFYVETYRGGDLLAEAYLLGYATDNIGDCFVTGILI
jgi:hypothetical protein